MRIKKLEIVGFKSFKDRTVIHFDQGITGIVGPNGCGKSNIVDALVWVMGEMSAKHLRGSSMEDVIFAGAEGYAPMGMAEVSLTLENDGGPFPAKYMRFSEVMITRRLHRGGESEYLINKESARLRDIHEIFMDTGAGSKGFSIIEQGAIGKIVTAKPEDRRTLIEEAAGITKFKVRKRESQRKLVATEQNLVRLQDILGEQKRQLDSLERQAQRAERYRNLKNELQEKELLLSAKSYLALHDERNVLEQSQLESKEQEGSSTSQLSQIEARSQELRLSSLEQEKVVEELQAQSQQALDYVRKLEFEIRELQFEMEQARRSQEMTGNIVEQSKAREMALREEHQRVQDDFARVKVEAEEAEANFMRDQSRLIEAQAEFRLADEELTTKRREMLTVSQGESMLEARVVSLGERLAEQQEKVERARGILEQMRTQKSEFENRRNQIFSSLEQERQMQLDIMKDVENFAANLEILKNQRDQKQAEVSQFKEELSQVTSQLYGLENLENNFEGFEEGVRQVLLWQRTQAETHADGSVSMHPVADLVSVPEKYEMAMEIALGGRLQLMLGHSSNEALGAVDYLKQQSLGRSSFLTEDLATSVSVQNQDQEKLKQESGVEALLSDVIQVPEQHRPMISRMLDGVAIVDSIRTALRLRPEYPGRTFVTLDGDSLSADGVITGGAAQSSEAGLVRRKREIKELSMKREEWAGKLSLAQLSLTKLEKQYEQIHEEFEAAKKRSVEKEIALAELKKDLERAETELRNAETASQRQGQDLDREQSLWTKLDDEKNELEGRLQEMKEKRFDLEQSMSGLDQRVIALKSETESLQGRVTDLQVKFASSKQEREGLDQRLQLLTRSLQEVETQLSQMTEESLKSQETLSTHQILIEQHRVELEGSMQKSEQLKNELSLRKNQFEEHQAHVRELDEELYRLRQTQHQSQSRLQEISLKLEQIKMKEQYLLDQLNERYMLDLRSHAENYRDRECDIAVLEPEVTDLKNKLSKIGDVNLAAIHEYDDLIGRYEFMNKQLTDLDEAKEQLKRVIDRINRICSRRFKDTFEQVNERFTKVFPVLFGGGEARLILVEDQENGEMGIDIVSRPPGKKAQNVSLLSGGEKALTAVSLIFAIFLVKPSPFCLLDEVDAPLDDANVFRFNDLVKEMAKRSQIIIVTHNKHTMKVNNVLYGVTQEEKGVSKMVSVALAAGVGPDQSR